MRVESSKKPDNPYRLVFVGQSEIEVVRTAFIEYVYDREIHGNSSSVRPFDRRVSNWWPYDTDDKKQKREYKERAIHTSRPLIIVDRLRELRDNTYMATEDMAELIGEVADTEQADMRMAGVEWRYNLGSRALALAQVVELKVSEYMVENIMATTDLDAEFARILAPKQLGP